MTTFAKATFNAATYSASRPSYPAKLFEHIFEFYNAGPPNQQQHARWECAVDVGCGTGQATTHLDGVFKNVVCVDPSPGMLRKAREFLVDQPMLLSESSLRLSSASKDVKTDFSFVQASAEDLRSAIPDDGSVDLLIAAQACHWFDWAKVWPETQRVLRNGGVAAFWVYGEIRLSDFPSQSPLITEFFQGTDRNSTTSVGAYFQRPGRTVLERSLVDVPPPSTILSPDSALSDFRRIHFTNDQTTIPSAPTAVHPTLLQAPWRWIDILNYFRTTSALHSYHEHFPDDVQKADDTRFLEHDLASISGSSTLDPSCVRGGDVATRFWKNLRQGIQQELGTREGVGLFDRVTVEWPLSLLLVRRR